MAEKSQSHVKDAIRSVIKDKAWYGLHPETGAFDWDVSVSRIALTLALPDRAVDIAFKDAFTPACLTQVPQEHEDKSQASIPLLTALTQTGIMPYIWTVGDPLWQHEKYVRSGAAEIVPEDHFVCTPRNKIQKLEEMVAELGRRGTEHIVVVDDKPDNIECVRKFNEATQLRGVTLYDYLMKLSSPFADPAAFYKWLMHLRASKPHLEVILDFDGVVADTDSVLFGPAVENLYTLLEKK